MCNNAGLEKLVREYFSIEKFFSPCLIAEKNRFPVFIYIL